MSPFIAQQTLTFLKSCLLGCAFACFYDVFRAMRLCVKNNRWLILAQDILFFSVCAIITFTFILTETDGQVRAFILLGTLLGATIYYFTIGALFVKIARKVLCPVVNFLIWLMFAMGNIPKKILFRKKNVDLSNNM